MKLMGRDIPARELLARLEENYPNDPSPLKIIRSTAELDDITQHVAARIMFGIKEEGQSARENYAERLWQWCKDCALPADKFEPDLYREFHYHSFSPSSLIFLRSLLALLRSICRRPCYHL